MNPESFSSLPEGQWLLQQVQTAFPNCPAEEQPDGVAILCTIRQTIGTSTALSGVYLVLSAAPTASVGTLDAAVSLYECIRMADVLGSCRSRFIRLGLHRIYKILLKKLEKLLKKRMHLAFFCEKWYDETI